MTKGDYILMAGVVVCVATFVGWLNMSHQAALEACKAAQPSVNCDYLLR